MISGSVVQDLDTLPALEEGRSKAPEADPVRAVPIDRVEPTLPFLSRPVAAMVRLQLLTGMRAGEVMAMRSGDIVKAEDVWTYRPASHRNAWRNKDRTILLGPRAGAIVAEFLKPEPSAHLFDSRDVVAEHHAARAMGRKTRRTPRAGEADVAADGEPDVPAGRRQGVRRGVPASDDLRPSTQAIHAARAEGGTAPRIEGMAKGPTLEPAPTDERLPPPSGLADLQRPRPLALRPLLGRLARRRRGASSSCRSAGLSRGPSPGSCDGAGWAATTSGPPDRARRAIRPVMIHPTVRRRRCVT